MPAASYFAFKAIACSRSTPAMLRVFGSIRTFMFWLWNECPDCCEKGPPSSDGQRQRIIGGTTAIAAQWHTNYEGGKRGAGRCMNAKVVLGGVMAFALWPAPCCRLGSCQAHGCLKRIAASLACPQVPDTVCIDEFRPFRHVQFFTALVAFDHEAGSDKVRAIAGAKFHWGILQRSFFACPRALVFEW